MRRVALLMFLTACAEPSVTFSMLEQNNSGQDGTATLTDDGTGVHVAVSIKPSNIMSNETSHIHYGRCSDVGAIVFGLSFISNVDAGADIDGGELLFSQELTGHHLSEFTDHNHIINVHDPRDFTLYVSCGEIN